MACICEFKSPHAAVVMTLQQVSDAKVGLGRPQRFFLSQNESHNRECMHSFNSHWGGAPTHRLPSFNDQRLDTRRLL